MIDDWEFPALTEAELEEQDRRDAACAAALGMTVEEMFQWQADEYMRSNYPATPSPDVIQ